jgi:hypothetical protein
MRFSVDKILFSYTSILVLFIGTRASDVVDKNLQHSKSIIDWIRSNNGFFHSSLEMRHSDPSDLTSEFGMFSTADIEEGTLLLSIPDDVILRSSDGDKRSVVL